MPGRRIYSHGLHEVGPEVVAERQAEVVAYLQGLVERLQDGSLQADAAVVVLQAGEEPAVLRVGFEHKSWGALNDALRYATDATWAEQYGRTISGRDWVLERRADRVAEAAAVERERAAKPYECACGLSYATARGHEQHLRALRRHLRDRGWITLGSVDAHTVTTYRPEPRGVALQVVQ